MQSSGRGALLHGPSPGGSVGSSVSRIVRRCAGGKYICVLPCSTRKAFRAAGSSLR